MPLSVRPAATEYRASSGSPAGAALRNVTASVSTSSPMTSTPPTSISRMPSLSGAGIAYRLTSWPPCSRSCPKKRSASGPGISPATACSRANISVSSISVTTTCAATVSGRASGTRRAAAPTPACTPSSSAA